ncbi:branched-chain amino acid ABC transporter permease [Phreatobacter aquaticus]|uniref:Branched-chain amino acid ABC transporter permease n=1 Tax=Phreatobacter aquaticus TaxID=2570229 RepID=A0A4D7QCX3_9HYPH|nr:branched-chain amino acid ABC transporter permease [Phreatobacter aquaticus]QCK85850.1 branched-chain amino acid ABC transporter permease [Phreatobacter aquaticus]
MLSAIIQALMNGIVSGTILAVPAIGFTAIFAVLRYPNFAIGALATVGAYAGWLANTKLGLRMEYALPFALVGAGAVGLAAEQLAIRPLSKASALMMAICSLAVGIIIENLIRFFFGNDPRGFDVPLTRDVRFWELRISPQQVENFLIALAIMTILWLALNFTRMGRAMRAIADNPDLARLKGVEPATISAITVFVGAGLAGMGGMLVALDTAADPLTGFRLVLSVFAAAVLGGLGSIPGAVGGALIIGMVEELTVLLISPNYRTAIGFLIILGVLTIRPAGLFGERQN